MMQTKNSKLYHNHISSGIQKFDERKTRYLRNRLKFISKFCQPIQVKIDKLKKDIQQLESKKKINYSLIQQNIDIVKIKKQKSQYINTYKYYQRKMNQFSEAITEKKLYIEALKKQINFKKAKYKVEYQKDMNKQTLHSLFTSRFCQSNDEQMEYKSQQLFSRKQKFQLPSISSNYISYVMKEKKKKLKKNELAKGKQKSMRFIERGTENSEQVTIRERIINFTNNQILFRECFERRKVLVQKEIGQLYSKLIIHKDVFMEACHSIANNQKSISYSDFSLLEMNEIIALFISFGWLQRRLFAQFSQKRKQIIKYIPKLPNEYQ